MSISRAVLPLFFLLGALPGHSFASTYNSVQVNGMCKIGTCDYTNPVPFSNSATESFSLTTTLGNGDMFLIAGTADANSNSNGSTLSEGVDYQVTYLGDGSGGTSLADTIDVNLFVAFETTLSSGNFDAGALGYLGSGLGTGSSAKYTGYGPTLQGPFTTPGSFNGNYSYSMPPVSNAYDFEISSQSVFAAGSAVDSAIVYGAQNAPVTPTPEPATLALLGGALIVIARLRWRHR